MIEETLLEASEKMDKAVDVAKDDFATVRTGRANAAMFSKITVLYYGSPTPLQQLASFQNPEARTLLITPFDRSSLNDIERALRDSDLGANPSNDRRKAKDGIDKAVKDGDAGEDEGSRAEKELDSRTKSHTDTIDELLKRKETELLEV